MRELPQRMTFCNQPAAGLQKSMCQSIYKKEQYHSASSLEPDFKQRVDKDGGV